MSEDINVTDGTVLEALNNKVDLDGGNYVGSGLEDVVEQTHWSKKITNCLTEIPQRIKVELVDGSVVLKAGSEVIVPNGFEADGTTQKFDYVTIESDISQSIAFSGSYDDVTLCYNADTNSLGVFRKSTENGSGTESVTIGYYYNTSTNLVSYYTDSTADGYKYSLPLGVFSNSTSSITKINDVFNGFGYIGQCTFVDKGVKVLIPNGRNADGTLKNSEVVTSKLTIVNLSGQNSILSLFDGVGLFGYGIDNYIVQDSKPTITTTYAIWYSPKDNFVYSTSDGGATWGVANRVYLGLLTKTDATSNITFMTPKKTFRAVDYNELEEVELIPTGYDTPVSVTSDWVATGNGQLYMYGYSDSASHYLEVYIDGNIVYLNRQSGSNANNHKIGSTTQIFKGQTITVKNSGAYTLTFYPYKY